MEGDAVVGQGVDEAVETRERENESRPEVIADGDLASKQFRRSSNPENDASALGKALGFTLY